MEQLAELLLPPALDTLPTLGHFDLLLGSGPLLDYALRLAFAQQGLLAGLCFVKLLLLLCVLGLLHRIGMVELVVLLRPLLLLGLGVVDDVYLVFDHDAGRVPQVVALALRLVALAGGNLLARALLSQVAGVVQGLGALVRGQFLTWFALAIEEGLDLNQVVRACGLIRSARDVLLAGTASFADWFLGCGQLLLTCLFHQFLVVLAYEGIRVRVLVFKQVGRLGMELRRSGLLFPGQVQGTPLRLGSVRGRLGQGVAH